MLSSLSWLFDLYFTIFKICFVLFSPFIFMILFFYIKRYIKGERRIPNTLYFPQKKKSFLKRLFIDFPKQYVDDLYKRDPGEFRDFGLRIIDGRQGCGKTSLLSYLLLKYKKEYPNCMIGTNYGYKGEDFQINDWRDILPTAERANGIYGRVIVIDEIQNYFSTASSRDFNPAVLQEICQQRKQHSVIYGTTQVFSRLAKQIREQTYILMSPFTICGCLTVVREYNLQLTEDATIDKKKLRKIWFFVHNKELRDAFDTFKKIEKYNKEGFIPVEAEPTNNFNVTVQTGKSRRFSKKEK